MRGFTVLTFLLASLGAAAPAMAQDQGGEAFNARIFIRENGLHVWGGYTTLTLAAATGTAALAGWDAHPYLGYATMGTGAVTLSLGLLAYPDKLDRIWPHVLLMGVAETCWMLNAFVWEPGSLPHRVTGVTSLVSLGAAYVAIRLIEG